MGYAKIFFLFTFVYKCGIYLADINYKISKSMEKFNFEAWALIASKAYCGGKPFTMWNKSFSTADLSGKVIFFNVDEKSEIKTFLQNYHAKSDDERVFVDECLKMIGITGFDHEVPSPLVDLLNKCALEVKKDDIIYLSWVSNIK